MAVPLLDLNAQNLALESELKAAFERVLRSGQFILGPEGLAFEKEIAQMIGAKHALGVSSGTDAILLALMTLDIKAGDEVICPTYTFFATAGCIARAGAVPVFVDSDPITFNVDPADIAKKITSRTKAIMPVHLFGQCAEMDPILKLGREKGIRIIEDGAQALGAIYKGRQAGTMGDFGTFSFFPSKNLGGFGDSGMLATNDDALAERATLLRTHGSKPKYYHKFVGGNFRMDPLQCALLRTKLPHYRRYTERRQANAVYYTEQLGKLPGVEKSSANPGAGAKLLLPVAAADRGHIWNQYTLRVLGEGRRDALKNHLGAKGIGTEIYYPVPMHQQECFTYVGTKRESLPVANRLAQEALSIPIFPELRREQLDEVIAAIAEFVAS
jgi:dTDP-4-amino-4,6-dideoxygalactose transaminase